MAQHQPLAARRRPAVPTPHDLQVGAAHADRERLDQQVALLGSRLIDIVEAGAARLHRDDRDGLHGPSWRMR
jgi:hypothetical protein